jgi:dihydroorotate dehydrogenase electron transfer subunit
MNPIILDSRGHLPRPYTIREVRVENPTTRTFVLDGDMGAVPGQFVMAWLPGLDEKPFSLSTSTPVALTVDRVGPFTAAMHELSAGDRIWLRGPLGQGFTLCQGPLLIVSGGCGVAPLHDLAQVARQAGRQVVAVLGARTAEGLIYPDRFAGMGCAVAIATDDGSAGEKGTAIDGASAILQHGTTPVDTLYACGPEPMLEAAYHLAQVHGLPCQLSYEAYMRCGIGVCGSCAREGCLVCRDGPVFRSPPASRGTVSSSPLPVELG